MDVAITGASGLIGSALSQSLRADGHQVRPVGRRGGSGTISWDPEAGTIDAAALEGVDAVVHLAGEGVASGPWTDEQRRRIKSSRTKGTTLLATTLAGLDRKPAVLISGSAIGYYGDRGDEELTERSTPADDFLAQVCVAWEASTAAAHDGRHPGRAHPYGRGPHGRRRRAPEADPPLQVRGGRTGRQGQGVVVVDHPGRRGAGHPLPPRHGRVGPGEPHGTQPRDRQGARARPSGACSHRPAALPIPRFISKVPFGVGDLVESLLFTSARVRPTVLESAGFEFTHSHLEGALRAVLGRAAA